MRSVNRLSALLSTTALVGTVLAVAPASAGPLARPVSATTVGTAAVTGLDVTCTVTGRSRSGVAVRTTATTELVAASRVDVFRGGALVPDPGFVTPASQGSSTANDRSPRLEVGRSFYYLFSEVAPGVKVERATGSFEEVVYGTVALADASRSRLEAITDPARQDAVSRRLSDLLGGTYDGQEGRVPFTLDWDRLGQGPVTTTLTVAELHRGRPVTFPVSLTCSR